MFAYGKVGGGEVSHVWGGSQGRHGARGRELRLLQHECVREDANPTGSAAGIASTRAGGRHDESFAQCIIRQNLGRFRMCYDQARAGAPQLEGAYSGLSFPQPEGGIVAVVSPLFFRP